MGFRYEPRQYNLNFEQPELNGLVVKAKSITIDEFSDMLGLQGTIFTTVELRSGAPLGDTLLGKFLEALVEWNLEDEQGETVKSTIEACRKQDLWLMKTIVNAWIQTISGVSTELGKGSASGQPSPEASLPMEPLSENLPS